MNDNPDGTPNPLNPGAGDDPDVGGGTLDANPSEPFNQPMRPRARNRAPGAKPVTSRPVDPMMSGGRRIDGVGTSSAMPDFTNSSTPEPEPTPVPPEPASAEPIDPLAHQMEQVQMPTNVEPPKKKKTGLIVGIIVGLIVIIGCVVAAVVLMNMNKGDAVAAAVTKILSGETPENVTTTGTIELRPNTATEGLSGLTIDLNSDAITSSYVNQSTANLKAEFGDGNSLSIKLEELYAPSGDLYIKISGIKSAIQEYIQNLSPSQDLTDQTNCVEDGSGETNCTPTEPIMIDCEEGTDCVSSSEALATEYTGEIMNALGNIFDAIDGKYIKLSTEEIDQLMNSVGSDGSSIECVAAMLGGFKSNRNIIYDNYKNSAFISSTKEGVTLASATGNPVYKVLFDKTKAQTFSNAMENTSFAKSLHSCMDSDIVDGMSLDADNLPSVYAEVDGDDNFTRIYLEGTLSSKSDVYDDEDEEDIVDEEAVDELETTEVDTEENTTSVLIDEEEADVDDENTTSTIPTQTMNILVDLRFTYPNIVNIAEPEDYTDVNGLQQILGPLFSGFLSSNTVVEEQ